MISKEERAELRKKLSDASHSFPLPWRTGDYEEVIDANGHEVAECVERHHTGDSAERCIAAAVNAMPVILDALDAADERIAGLEKEAKHWRESALAWAHWAASVTGESDQEIPDLTKFVATLKARIAELEAAAQWRPMDTVPTDGTHVVVYMGFRDGAPHFETRRYIAPPLLGRSTSTHWRWLPIPALPEGGV